MSSINSTSLIHMIKLYFWSFFLTFFEKCNVRLIAHRIYTPLFVNVNEDTVEKKILEK